MDYHRLGCFLDAYLGSGRMNLDNTSFHARIPDLGRPGLLEKFSILGHLRDLGFCVPLLWQILQRLSRDIDHVRNPLLAKAYPFPMPFAVRAIPSI